ncbi:AAA family ATPase [Campylobacter jejuni]|uniref:AAA family ATPase n=1 Tax=Campylobacter jejuni TaxID=197 RepID=UPI0002584DBF|nr:AAA family ATPase [Campylobacter jejuni]EIB89391.1 McrBC restriction endonuclease system, McrB subunit, putative [Campylobacter jejuni subsp. jejuni LMG 23210]MDC8037805.1 AAA family ATPase [Campylobacter jejuni]MDC8094631.1 AAA family ATPase [Campylobacter jejuni]HEB9988487.1 AAA family ATPase [Campylobacter jejuni]HEC0015995.1 AAA family ATPase [Campylobacter jejuni]
MIVLSSDDKKRFKKYLVDFFHNAYNGNKLSSKDEVVNFNFFKKYDFYVDLSYGKGNVAKIPWIIFIRMDTQEYKASYGVYVYCGIKRENREIVVCIGESEDKTVNYLARNKVDEYNAQFNHQVYNYSNLSNDINLIVDKIILNMQWFKELPLNEIQDININTLESKSLEVENNVQQISSKMENKNMPLNQILYGSPGTGKTYHTIDKALEILGKNLESRDDKKAKFDEYVKKGQIVFTTFHQSYGYEEFVEGIKPRIDSKENSKEIEYEIKDGIFKELCEKALDNYENSILNADELNKKIELKEKVENFLNWLLETNEPIGKTKGGNFFVVEIDNKTIVIYSEGVERFDGIFNLNLSIFMELLKCKDEFNNATEMFKKVFNRDYADRTHTYYFNLVKKFKAYEEKQLTAKIENNKNNDNSLKPYIIIIDEINRGNVSKIFGELITLIEASKRIGEKEELKVTLPYSGKEFGVPKNVYIIGTMNTADRSITSLDTALRRRFEFIEMMPDVSKLSMDCEGINLQELLKAINTRIEYLLDREKTIGHAFFVSVENLEDLKKVFQNKIIPLLQEYFYNDYALINEVLNDNGMIFEDKKDDKYLQKIKNLDSVNSERSIYNIASFDDKIWDKIEIYQAIYNDEIANKLKNENE